MILFPDILSTALHNRVNKNSHAKAWHPIRWVLDFSLSILTTLLCGAVLSARIHYL
mgnify:CR=1 FL=1